MARYSESAFQNFHTVRSVRSVSSKAKESRSKFIHCIFLYFSVSQFFPGAEKRVNRKKGGGPSGIPRVPALPFPCLPLLDCHFSKQKLHCDEARLRRMMAHHKELLSRLALGGGIGLFKHKSMISWKTQKNLSIAMEGTNGRFSAICVLLSLGVLRKNCSWKLKVFSWRAVKRCETHFMDCIKLEESETELVKTCFLSSCSATGIDESTARRCGSSAT